MAGIIVWGAVCMTLLLVIAVGAMIQYIEDRKKSKNAGKYDWNKMVDMIPVATAKTTGISEPVTSFIKCFKDNPKRFKLVRGSCLKDTVKNMTYVFRISSQYQGGGKVLPRLHNIDKRLQWLTENEGGALVDAMYPYFVTERRERLHAIQRQRLTRIYKEKPDV